jgi:L-asparaginase II
MPPVPLARLVRSGLEESIHTGDIAVVDADGSVVAFAGDPNRQVFARSSMKPLQATVSLSLAPFDFTDREIAVMCASHNAEPVHIDAVRSLLARAGVEEDALLCPSVRPWDDESLAADPERRRINSDCSGKHGGMLAACVAKGWPLPSYRDPDHPLQQEILGAVLLANGEGRVHIGVDGCGVPVHGMPLRAMATIYARLVRPERLGDLEKAAARAVGAMRAEPYMVAGRNRPDTAVMQQSAQVIAKGGAEGLMCAAELERGWGVAVKMRDGASRATGPVLIHALRSLGLLEERSLADLEAFARPPVLGGGQPVGEIVAEFELTSPA